MPHLALRGIPDHVQRELQAAAVRNRRSLNGEIVARSTASVCPAPVDAQALLDRIAQRHEGLGPIDLSEPVLQQMRNAGHP